MIVTEICNGGKKYSTVHFLRYDTKLNTVITAPMKKGNFTLNVTRKVKKRDA